MASGHGENCTYCKREMRTDVEVHHPLFATRDHFIPKSKVNGNPNKKVWACYQCNQLKADRFPEQWERFMARNPRWWDHPALNDGVDVRPKLPRVEQQKPKPPPYWQTMRFLKNAAFAKLRPLRKDEPIPKAYDDPVAQAAYEAAMAKYKYLLRVPA